MLQYFFSTFYKMLQHFCNQHLLDQHFWSPSSPSPTTAGGGGTLSLEHSRGVVAVGARAREARAACGARRRRGSPTWELRRTVAAAKRMVRWWRTRGRRGERWVAEEIVFRVVGLLMDCYWALVCYSFIRNYF
jgi:hypothetical protein